MQRPTATGFTLTELVATMIIIGILAVAALPRMLDRQVYDARAFYDETISILRYAQKAAIAQRRLVCVSFSDNHTVSLTIAAAYGAATCGNPLTGPTGNAPYTITSSRATFGAMPPSGINFTPAGRPTWSGSLQVTGAAASIVVEPETGYVH